MNHLYEQLPANISRNIIKGSFRVLCKPRLIFSRINGPNADEYLPLVLRNICLLVSLFPVTIFAFDILSIVHCFSCNLTTLSRTREQDKAGMGIEYAKRKLWCYVGLILNCFQVIFCKILTDKSLTFTAFKHARFLKSYLVGFHSLLSGS